MHTPADDYRLFWECMALAVWLSMLALIWIASAFTVIGGMRKKTFWRVIAALVFGPLLLRNRGYYA